METLEPESGASVARFFLEGGFWMWPILLLGLVALAVALAAAVSSRPLLVPIAAVVALVPASLGVLGMVHGRSSVDEAVVFAHPGDQELIRREGYREAQRPVQLGGGETVLALAVVAAAFARQRVTAPPASA